MTPASRPARRLALAAGLLIAALISCGREITGPVSAPVNTFKRFAALAVDPQYATALTSSALRAALTQVAFERVRVTLRREDGSIALDTVVDFPAGADSLTLSLIVPLAANAPSTGVPFNLSLGYVNAAGDTVFKGGPIPITVTPSTGSRSPPAPVQVPVHYTGTGSNATSVVISPKLVNGTAGQSTSFSAQAMTSAGQVIAGTPIVFSSSDAGVVTVNSTSGMATLVGRGAAKVYAQLLTGPSDSATVVVVLPASRIELSSGSAQTAPAGSTLPQPVVARVLAADGIGVGGVTVNFAVPAGDGSVTPVSAVSAADGTASTSWKLGGTAGTQTMTVTSAGLGGSPLSVSATALPVVASRLVITTGPVGGKAGAPIGAVVAAQDALGNTATSFAGDVSVAIGANPGAAALGGTATVKAVNGIATFSGLMLNRPGTGYTLTFSSTGLAGATSAAFNVLTGDAAKLVFGPMPATADVGIAIVPPVQVFTQDSSGNTVTTFTGAVTVAFGANTGGGTLTGTLTRNAAAGITTFSDLSINRKGSSYTLVASSAGLVTGTSAAFNMAPGAPSGISVVSGNAQTAPAGTALRPIVLQLHDALGNGIAGATITLAIATGGGSLGATSLVTDADGHASVTWTIGSGPQTMTATYSGLSPITITATSTTALLTWTGATSTDWNVASNWSGGSVPTSTDDVLIPAATAANPRINYSSPDLVTVGYTHNLTIEAGKSIDLGCSTQLRVTGNVVAPLDADAVLTCEGEAINLMGDGAAGGNTVVGKFQMVAVNGNYKVSGPGNRLIVTYDLTMDGTGNLTVNGGRVDATGLFTASDATFTMTNALDQVFFGGSGAHFNGASSSLTAGTMTITDGALTSSANYFAPSGTHMVVFAGISSVNFSNPVLSFLRNAKILASGTMLLDNNTVVTGTLSTVSGSAMPLTVTAGAYPQPTRLLTVNGLYQTGADQLQFTNVMLTLTGTSSVTFANVKFQGFDPAFTGSLFEVNRTDGPFTFNGLDFSLAGFSADTSKHFIKNSGSANITISSSNPASGTNGTHYILGGTGTVSWP